MDGGRDELLLPPRDPPLLTASCRGVRSPFTRWGQEAPVKQVPREGQDPGGRGAPSHQPSHQGAEDMKAERERGPSKPGVAPMAGEPQETSGRCGADGSPASEEANPADTVC
ncbi:hypothetical protein H1C71_005284 [Ictidomys tridecemlineatus]|nr:hypothetical protein H1C71_005284 [Ictidomys tridecemlineatus]